MAFTFMESEALVEGLNPRHARVVQALVWYGEKYGSIRPSWQGLAKRAGVCRSTLHTALVELRKTGRISWVDDNGMPSLYFVRGYDPSKSWTGTSPNPGRGTSPNFGPNKRTTTTTTTPSTYSPQESVTPDPSGREGLEQPGASSPWRVDVIIGNPDPDAESIEEREARAGRGAAVAKRHDRQQEERESYRRGWDSGIAKGSRRYAEWVWGREMSLLGLTEWNRGHLHAVLTTLAVDHTWEQVGEIIEQFFAQHGDELVRQRHRKYPVSIFQNTIKKGGLGQRDTRLDQDVRAWINKGTYASKTAEFNRNFGRTEGEQV